MSILVFSNGSSAAAAAAALVPRIIYRRGVKLKIQSHGYIWWPTIIIINKHNYDDEES